MADYAVMAVAMLGTGIAGGVLAGLLGVGGGIVIVPVLEIVLGILGVPVEVRMHVAVATSLAVIIPTSMASARAHYKRQSVDTQLARRWAGFILIGAVAGIVIASHANGAVLSGLFAAVALVVAIKMALPMDDITLTSAVPAGFLTGVIPASVGTISTMMGIGGGTLSVPALTLMNTPIHRAVGTSSLFGLLISIPGAIGFAIAGWGNELLPTGSLGFVNLIGFALIAPATVVAAPLGARIAHALSRRNLSLLFGLFLLLVSVRMFYRTIQGA